MQQNDNYKLWQTSYNKINLIFFLVFLFCMTLSIINLIYNFCDNIYLYLIYWVLLFIFLYIYSKYVFWNYKFLIFFICISVSFLIFTYIWLVLIPDKIWCNKENDFCYELFYSHIYYWHSGWLTLEQYQENRDHTWNWWWIIWNLSMWIWLIFWIYIFYLINKKYLKKSDI